MKLKVYEITMALQDYVIAHTAIEALHLFARETGIGLSGMSDVDDIRDVPENEWDNIRLRDDDGNIYTVKDAYLSTTKPTLLTLDANVL